MEQDQVVSEEVTTGTGTVAGLGAAVAQFVTALVILFVGGPTEAATTTFGTAAATLAVTVGGRMYQAAAAKKAKALVIAAQATASRGLEGGTALRIEA